MQISCIKRIPCDHEASQPRYLGTGESIFVRRFYCGLDIGIARVKNIKCRIQVKSGTANDKNVVYVTLVEYNYLPFAISDLTWIRSK